MRQLRVLFRSESTIEIFSTVYTYIAYILISAVTYTADASTVLKLHQTPATETSPLHKTYDCTCTVMANTYRDGALFFMNQEELTPGHLLDGLECTALYFRRVSLTHELCHNVEVFFKSSSWRAVELDAVEGEVDYALSVFLSRSSPIRELNFCSMNRMTTESWVVLGKRYNNLQSLTLSWTEIPSAGMRNLAEGIQYSNNLETLDLSCTFWTNDDNERQLAKKLNDEAATTEEAEPGDYAAAQHFSRGLAENKTLKDLILNGCSLSDASVALIVEALKGHPGVRKLWLSMNRCGEKTSAALEEWLSNPICQLLELYMDGQRFPRQQSRPSATGITKLNISLISNGLRSNNSLKVLDLTDNHFICDRDLELLGRALSSFNENGKSNSSLEKLLLARCGITSSGLAAFLHDILPGIRCLQTLSLGGNLMEDISNKSQSNLIRNRAIKAMVQLEDVALLQAIASPEHLPLALCPFVLHRLQKVHQVAKTRHKTTSKNADLLYQFLRGPMLSHLSSKNKAYIQ